jgi:hypothetical protein
LVSGGREAMSCVHADRGFDPEPNRRRRKHFPLWWAAVAGAALALLVLPAATLVAYAQAGPSPTPTPMPSMSPSPTPMPSPSPKPAPRAEWHESLASVLIAAIWATALVVVAGGVFRAVPLVLRWSRRGEDRPTTASLLAETLNRGARISTDDLDAAVAADATLVQAVPGGHATSRLRAQHPANGTGVTQAEFDAAKAAIEAFARRVYDAIFVSHYRLLRACATGRIVTLADADAYYADGTARGNNLPFLDWIDFCDRFGLIRRVQQSTGMSQQIALTNLGRAFLAYCDREDLDDRTIALSGRGG